MNLKIIIAAAAGTVFIILIVVTFVTRLKSRRALPNKFRANWLEVQRLCASKETWALAVINADKLLEEGLKKKRFKGKSMGERMVAAQRIITDNDGVWYAHNLAKKLLDETHKGLREAQVKKSLIGIRQALRDIGLLNGK